MTTIPKNLKIGLPVFVTGNKTFMVKGESKMKKNIFFIIFVFLAASVFAQKFGLDVSLGGSFGIQNIEQKEGSEQKVIYSFLLNLAGMILRET